MGRPRKRRREGGAESDDNIATSTDMNGESTIDLDMSAFQDLASITPPLDDSTYPLESFPQIEEYSNGSYVSPLSAIE
jgi:hypothetical protein